MNPTVKTIVLPTGLSLEYATSGQEGGVPILLLHGYSDSWRSFEPVFAHLPKSFRAIALSQRGQGNSAKPDDGYRSQHFAEDVAAFLTALGIERAVVVGHSMGSQVALRFAAEHPERVTGLVLIGAYDTMKRNAVVQDLWDSAVVRLEDPVDPLFVRAFQESTLAGPVTDEFLDMVVTESLKVPARVWRAICAGLLQDDLGAAIGSIAVPTLILWGDADTICGWREQKALTAAIKGAQLKVYRGAGHALHWERPGQVAKDIIAFVGEIAGAGSNIKAA